ncbi:MAG: autotransporter domain-containing protein [Alphaproteobacteria bacterium]|nr:autotransporter domain-containing protein [Alphaproteobacteria bacterium]
MSNTKHLADLVKVCSILPALAIMPAMAEVVEKTASVAEPVDYVTNTKTDELGRDSYQKGLIRVLNLTAGSFSHDLDTNVMVVAPDDAGKITADALFSGIQNQPAEDIAPVVNVEGDNNTVLTLTSDEEGTYPLVSRFAKLNIGTESQSLGEVNLKHTNGGAAIYITDAVTDNNKTGQGHVGNQELNIYANKVSIETAGTAITGNEGKLNLVANETLDIVGDINGYNDVYGGKAHMTIDINQNDGNVAKTTIRGNIGAAQGSAVNIGLKGTGSSITGDVLVSANGEILPGGGINLAFGDEGTINGNITAKDKGVVEITAKDDFEINGNVYAVTEGSSVDINANEIEVESKTDGVLASDKAIINIGTNGAKEIEIAAITDGRGARADNGAVLNIGSVDTESVEISANDNYGVMALYLNSKVNIDGKYINIANNASGKGAIHAGVNVISPDHDYSTSATVNIEGDNIVITNDATDGTAVAAMSQGVVNIIGNTTIKADKAIVARGEAQVNINKQGDKVVKMLGNIDFNYDKATSGSKVDAYVDVTLAGTDSFWTGNTVASYGSGKAPDESYLKVSSSKLTMKNGAVWNATKVVDSEGTDEGSAYAALNDLIIDNGTVNIQDTTRGIFVDRIVANDATFTGGKLNVNESIQINSGLTTFSGNVFGGEGATLTLASGAEMDIGTSKVEFENLKIDGTVIASVTNGRPYGRLYGTIDAGEDALLKLNVGSVGTYKIFDTETEMQIDAGLAYVVTNKGLDGIVVETKAIEDLATDAGISMQAAGAVAGLTQVQDPTLKNVSLALQEALNSGDTTMVERETRKLNPTDKPVVQAAASSVQNQVLALTSGRMSAPAPVIGRAGGDAGTQENGFWMQGLFNKSKFADQFHGYTRGVALGADTLIDDTWTIGGGLAINNSDVHADGVHTDIDSKTVFLYGQYKPTQWFINATATYTMSEYTDNKTIAGAVWNETYDVDSYGAQVMTGYDFATGITTEVGARYLHIAQDANGFAKALDTDFLSGVAGVKYAFAIENDWAIQLRPELRAAMTYDFISDDAAATVVLPGVASYKVDSERLSRMGGEFGIGLTATYKGVDLSLMYDLDLHEDYTSQTGMIKLRATF